VGAARKVLEIGLTVFGRRIFRVGFAFVRVLGDFLKKLVLGDFEVPDSVNK